MEIVDPLLSMLTPHDEWVTVRSGPASATPADEHGTWPMCLDGVDQMSAVIDPHGGTPASLTPTRGKGKGKIRARATPKMDPEAGIMAKNVDRQVAQ